MTAELFTPENTSPESLLEAFDAALFETSLGDDREVMVFDQYKVFVMVHHQSTICFRCTFRLREGCSEEKVYALCNRINAGLIIIRASMRAESSLLLDFDWYLPLRGGISKKAVVRALRQFNELLVSVDEHDTGDLIL